MSFGRWLGLIALVAALVLLWSLREAMVLIFAAVVIATALCTIVGAIRDWLGCRRPLALAISLLAIVVLLGVGAAVIIPPFTAQFSLLLQKLPVAAHTLMQLLQGGLQDASRLLYGSDDAALSGLMQSLGQPGDGRSALATGLGGALRLVDFAGNVGSVLVKILFVLAVALMVTAQPQAYQEAVLLLTPSFYRRRFRQVMRHCGEALSAWMVGMLISCVCVGVMAAIGLTLLGVKLVAANAVLAGLLNFIPNVGPTLSTVFPMSVALLESPWKALAVLALYIVVQNLESYVITPSVMHHQLRLLPGLTLTAQLLFTVLFGPLGLLLALPLAVCLQVLLRDVVIHDILDGWKPGRSQR
ncbi:MAG: AI-2E family transporter [Synechococcaceae cyanobacterium]